MEAMGIFHHFLFFTLKGSLINMFLKNAGLYFWLQGFEPNLLLLEIFLVTIIP